MEQGLRRVLLVCALPLLGCEGEAQGEAEPQVVVEGSFRLAVLGADVTYVDVPEGAAAGEDSATLAMTVEVENLGSSSLSMVRLESFDLAGLWTHAEPTDPGLGEEGFPLASAATATLEFIVGETGMLFDCAGRDGKSYVGQMEFLVDEQTVMVTADTVIECRAG